MSEFFSAAATRAAKHKGRLVRYRSYKKGTYFDKISERYNFVDIYELTTFHAPLDFQKIQFYRENIEEPLLTASGQNGQIVGLSREPFYSAQGDHVVVPVQLKVRRFKFATDEDLEIWEEESKEEGITFAGSIPAITPVREILEKSAEAGLIHEATSDRDEQMRQMINSDGALLKTAAAAATSTTTTDYEEHFTPVGPCLRHDCSVCYGPLIPLEKETWFILGLHPDHKDVVTLRFKKRKVKKIQHLLKLAKLAQISMMSLEVMDSTEAIDKPSYYDELQ